MQPVSIWDVSADGAGTEVARTHSRRSGRSEGAIGKWLPAHISGRSDRRQNVIQVLRVCVHRAAARVEHGMAPDRSLRVCARETLQEIERRDRASADESAWRRSYCNVMRAANLYGRTFGRRVRTFAVPGLDTNPLPTAQDFGRQVISRIVKMRMYHRRSQMHCYRCWVRLRWSEAGGSLFSGFRCSGWVRAGCGVVSIR
jgi:hypothetical protein